MTDRPGPVPDRGAEVGTSLDISTTTPHDARVYDYLLGGVTHFAVDRAAAGAAAVEFPGGLEGARACMRANRQFLTRTVHWLAAEVGIRQFLDLGAGIPHAPNIHEVAQKAAPESRVVYVDNEPIVLAHAHQLLANARDGVIAYLDGDLCKVDLILEAAAERLDFDAPVAVILAAVLHQVPDRDNPALVVRRYLEAVPSGSHLVITHLTGDLAPLTTAAKALTARGLTVFLRDRDEIVRLFAGTELVEPGLVPVDQWRPDKATPNEKKYIAHYGGVGHKP